MGLSDGLRSDEYNEKIVSLAGGTAQDEALVLAARGGDGQAFETLVLRYRAKLFRVARRFARNAADAEDIVQQTFQKMFLHLHQFEGRSAFSTWLTRIARNEALLWIRRRSNAVEISLEQSVPEDGGTLSLDFPDAAPNPEDRYSQRELKEILLAAINELAPSLRKVVELRELVELSTEEIARVMDISVPAVKSRMFHARRKLQKALKRWMSRHRPPLISHERLT
jgi:RNA polymerase sigma-70 factor, ECF subfamily